MAAAVAFGWSACSKGRKGAPAAVLQLVDELWAFSTALDQLAAAASKQSRMRDSPQLNEIMTRMISNCRTSLTDLRTVVDKYEEINKATTIQVDGLRWIQKLRINVKKARWIFEEKEIQSLRERIGSHVRALNLLLSIVTSDTIREVESHLKKLSSLVLGPSESGSTCSQGNRVEASTLSLTRSSTLSDVDPDLPSKQNGRTNEIREMWYSLITEFAINSRCQMSVVSIYHQDKGQLSTAIETSSKARKQSVSSALSKLQAAQSTDDSEISGDLSRSARLLDSASAVMEELKLLVSYSESNSSIQLPDLIHIIMYECVVMNNKVHNASESSLRELEQCVDYGNSVGLWLNEARTGEASSDVANSDTSDAVDRVIDAYLALLRSLVKFWSWLLRGIKMCRSPIYPRAMLDYQPQLMMLKDQIIQESRQYWMLTRSQTRPPAVSKGLARVALNRYTQDYVEEFTKASSSLTRVRESLKPVEDVVEEEMILQKARRWPNTCRWILSKDSYCDWMLGIQPRLLWCHARPGAGKSVLASYLAQNLQAAGEICGYFPFRYNNEALRHTHHLLRTVAFQLASQDPRILQRLLDLSLGNLSIESSRTGVLWQRLFCNGIFQLQSTDPIYWVIDAIDEAEPNELLQFLSLLFDLQTSATPIKVIIFSRYTRDIASRLKTLPIAVSELLPDDNFQDIQLYAKERLSACPIAIHETYVTQILQSIIEGASGTFLWAAKVIDAIEQEDLIASVLSTLNDASQDLYQLYDNIFLRMSAMRPSQKQLAKAILDWTTSAARPLTIDELSVALKATFGTLTDIKSTLQNLCGQVLSIDKQQRVQANHMTVQEYLKERAQPEFRVDGPTCNQHIVSFCIKVLSSRQSSQEGLEGGVEDSAQDSRQTDFRTFCEYAALFWSVHICRLPCTAERVRETSDFLDSNGAVTWLKTLAASQKLDQILSTVHCLEDWLGHGESHDHIDQIEKLRSLAHKLGFVGESYSGGSVGGLRHGSGTCNYANGDKYVGDWKADVREGRGTCYFASGEVYEGLWSNDEFHGQGRLSSPDGNVYDGEWVFGRREGLGTMQWSWTERYEYKGEWLRDRFHGQGVMVYLFGSRYAGTWANGREHGQGKIIYWNGGSYEGEFEDGSEKGEIVTRGAASPVVAEYDELKTTATIRYPTGARYEGHIDADGLAHGEGTLFGVTGVSWTGTFINGRAEGQGVARRPRGGVMTGPWHNYVADGYFEEINDEPGGGRFQGQLVDAAREGYGRLESTFKYDYEGWFHRNEMHGQGTRRYHNGDVYEGESQDGSMEGLGTMRYNDGWVFEGLWQKNRKNGPSGSLTYPAWGCFKGTWKNDQLKIEGRLDLTQGISTLQGLP